MTICYKIVNRAAVSIEEASVTIIENIGNHSIASLKVFDNGNDLS